MLDRDRCPVKPVSLPKSPVDIQLKLMWRLLRLAFWLSAGTALLYMLANLQRGRLALALIDGVSLGALALGYRVSIRLGRPETGLQAVAIIAWLTLAITIMMHGGLRSPAIAWIVVLAPLLMLAGLKLALAMTAATVALIAGLYVAEVSGWTPPYLEVPLLQRAVSAALITCLFALSAWYALRWRMRLAEELEAARDAAIEANRLKGRFIANLNHEIRTPMNALVAAAQLLGRQHMGGEQRALVQAVQHSADHLLALVNDVLDYERLEAGEVRLDAIEFSLRDLAGSAIGMFRRAGRSQAALPASGLDGRAARRLDRRSDAIAPGVVQLAVELDQVHSGPWPRCAARGQCCDAGGRFRRVLRGGGQRPGDHSGCAGAAIPAVRARRRIDRPPLRGTGLGLSICKELLQLMNGSIEVESQPGAGSTFRVAVPLVRANREGQRLTSTESTGQANLPAGLKVMLVEDDPVNQIVMEAVLRDLGVQVLTADSGEQALDLMEQRAVDLVLMDCRMPEMDGLTTTRHWRDKEARLQRPRVPVIGLTGDVYSGAREACLEAGMDDYLTKPASRADIGAILARWAPEALQR